MHHYFEYLSNIFCIYFAYFNIIKYIVQEQLQSIHESYLFCLKFQNKI